MHGDHEKGEERLGREVAYLIIRAGGLRMAILSNSVEQLYAPQQLTPLPLAPRHILGISNFGGVVIPLFDILGLLKARARPGVKHSEGHKRVVVVSASGMTVGIICDEARGLKHIRHDQLQKVSSEGGDRVERIASALHDEEGELLVLNIAQLLEEARVKG